jgi:hypothetical protein
VKSKPTNADLAGSRYLALQRLARAQKRATAELLQLYVLDRTSQAQCGHQCRRSCHPSAASNCHPGAPRRRPHRGARLPEGHGRHREAGDGPPAGTGEHPLARLCGPVHALAGRPGRARNYRGAAYRRRASRSATTTTRRGAGRDAPGVGRDAGGRGASARARRTGYPKISRRFWTRSMSGRRRGS